MTWFWGAYQTAAGGTTTDVTSAARGGRNFNVSFGGTGTTTAIGTIEKFREMNVTLAIGAASGWSGVWEYASAVNARRQADGVEDADAPQTARHRPEAGRHDHVRSAGRLGRGLDRWKRSAVLTFASA